MDYDHFTSELHIDFPGLPCNAPRGHAHVIRTDSLLDTANWDWLSIGDVVVTILYNYDQAALKAFLDPERKEYVFWSHDNRPHELDVSITRTGKTLVVGWPLKDNTRWSDAVKCEISDSGNWKLVSAIYKYGIRVADPHDDIDAIYDEIKEAMWEYCELWKKLEGGEVISTHRMGKNEEGLFTLIMDLVKRGLFG